MGARKKDRKNHKRTGSVDVDAIRSQMQRQVNEMHSTPDVPPCLGKLVSANPSDREEGCIDIMRFALVPAHHTSLTAHKAHRKVAQLLLDNNVLVRAAAASALRNLLTSESGDQLLDEVVAQDNVAGALAQGVTELVSQHPTLLEAVSQAASTAAAESRSAAAAAKAEDEEEGMSQVEQLGSLLSGVESALDEFLQLSAVVAEGSEAATTFFSQPQFLSALIVAVCSMSTSTREGCVNAAVAAAECLHLLSRENDDVARFIASELTAEQFEALNVWISGGPGGQSGSTLVVSPRLLRLSLALAGTLVSCSPNEQNIVRVLPVLCHALQTQPLKEWSRVLPLLSEDCNLAEEVRTLATAQSADRFRSLQCAIDLLSIIVSHACDSHDDEMDDEVAFAQNPQASLLVNSGVFQLVVDILKDILQPYPDAVSTKALREATPNGEAATIQHLFLSVEVGIFGLASTLLLMLPIEALGSSSTVWRAVVIALQQRFELCTAEHDTLTIANESSSARHLLQLQIESLTELSWTVQRKDVCGQSGVEPHDLDIFTRLAWSALSSTETKIFTVGVVSCIGMRYRSVSADAMNACSRFCTGMLVEESLSIDVRAEAANSLMDLFNDEAYDGSLYVPLQLQSSLNALLTQSLLPALKESKRSGNRAQWEKLDEIAVNLKAFLQYKSKHCAGL